jgi:hypothetical protein
LRQVPQQGTEKNVNWQIPDLRHDTLRRCK